ncbi:MAG: ATPase domain-containing protein [Thermoanaerobaculia bacterium]
MTKRVKIRQLETNVPGLDAILGGGFPEFSFNLIAGAPGSGKTTLAHQIMFGMCGPDRSGLYFTVVGEPPLKMLRYQQQYSFFDIDRVDASIRFVNLGQEIVEGSLATVLARIIQEVEASNPSFVVVDSFRTMANPAERAALAEVDLQRFVQQLAIRLTGWEATTFLVGEYDLGETVHNPVFTVADGVLWLDQSVERNSVVRKMQVVKMRGQAPSPGLHTYRITGDGVEIFPRVVIGPAEKATAVTSTKRLSVGVPKVDEMLGGGIPPGFSLLLAGPSGSGKSVLATQFIMEGVRQGEPTIVAVFEKRPSIYSDSSPGGDDFQQMVRKGEVTIVQMRPLDLSIDETLHEIVAEIDRRKATRLVIDSLSGFELALAPTFRHEFRESLYRMVAVLTGKGITVVMTAELEDSYADLRFSPHGTAFLTDAIIVQRYVEIGGRLQPIMTVVKVRGSAHSRDFYEFGITDEGIVIGEPLAGFEGLLTGSPSRVS